MRNKGVQIMITAALIGSTLLIGGCGSPDVSHVNMETAVIETKIAETVQETEPPTTATTEAETTEVSTEAITEPETIAEETTATEEALMGENNPPETLEKTMYATADVNVRDSSSADGNKVGSLGYGIGGRGGSP